MRCLQILSRIPLNHIDFPKFDDSKGKRDLLLEKLPSEFNRSVIMDLASFIGIKEKTAENYITSFIQQNSITRLEHNSYKKLI